MKFENLTFSQKKEKIEEIINKKIRPALAMDGGSLELIDIKEDEEGLKIMIRYLSACQGCASSSSTLWAIEQELINNTDDEKIKVIEVK
jgi:NifU-like protein